MEADAAGGMRIWRESAGESVSIYALADPRWNRPGFAGVRLRLIGVEPGRRIGLTLSAWQGAKRPSWRGEVALAADGVVTVDRTTVPLPAEVSWSEVFRLNLDGLGVEGFVLADLVRL